MQSASSLRSKHPSVRASLDTGRKFFENTTETGL